MKSTDKQMNILHLISSFEMGGAEKLLLDMVTSNSATAQQTVQMTVVVMNDLVDDGMVKELLRTGCAVYFLKRPPSHWHPKYLFQLLRIIRKHRIQLLHCHTYGSKMWAVLCKLVVPKLKVVYTIHDMNVIRQLSRLQLLLHRNLIDHHVAISEAVLQECRKRNVENATRIYNGILLSKYAVESDEQKPGGSVIQLVNVARITYRIKGHDLLIKAVKACKERGLQVKCSFIGGVYDYDEASLRDLEALIEQLGLQHDVEFLGRRSDVHRLLGGYDIFVLPSRTEGLGLAVIEAMAAGLPVIASNLEGPAELIQHGRTGILFEKENVADLTAQIERLATDPSLYRTLVKNGAERAQQFDIAVMLERYADMYNNLIRRPAK